MDSIEWNKIFGGVLASILAIIVIREATHVITHHEPPTAKGYIVELPEAQGGGGTVVKAAPPPLHAACAERHR